MFVVIHVVGVARCSREALLTPQSSEQQNRLSTVIIAEEQSKTAYTPTESMTVYTYCRAEYSGTFLIQTP